MQPSFPSSAPSGSSKLPVAKDRAEPVGEIRIGSQVARVFSPAGLNKLRDLLASARTSVSTDLQIRG